MPCIDREKIVTEKNLIYDFEENYGKNLHLLDSNYGLENDYMCIKVLGCLHK